MVVCVILAKALVAAQAYHLQQQRLAAAQTVAPSISGPGAATATVTVPGAPGMSSLGPGSTIVKNPIVTVGPGSQAPLAFARGAPGVSVGVPLVGVGAGGLAAARATLLPGQQLLPYTGQATRAQLGASGAAGGGATLVPGGVRPALIPNAATQTLNMERLIEEQLRPDNWVSIFPTSSDLLRLERWESKIIFDAQVLSIYLVIIDNE